VFMGIARLGAVQVNVNPLYTPRELGHQLNDAGVKTIVVFNGSTPTLAEVVKDTGVTTIITAGPGDGLPKTLPAPAIDARLTHTRSMGDILSDGMPTDYTAPTIT